MLFDFLSKVRVDYWKIFVFFDVWFGLNRFFEVFSFIGCIGVNLGFFFGWGLLIMNVVIDWWG